MQIDQAHNTWWFNLDETLKWVVWKGIDRLLAEGLWSQEERADLVRLRDGFQGLGDRRSPDPELWVLLGEYYGRLWH